jgi:hypothetical protein
MRILGHSFCATAHRDGGLDPANPKDLPMARETRREPARPNSAVLHRPNHEPRSKPKSWRPSPLQWGWLVRIGEAGQAGLVVEDKKATATIRSLLRRELIWNVDCEGDDGTGRRTYCLTEAGAVWIRINIVPSRGRPEEGGGASPRPASLSLPSGLRGAAATTASIARDVEGGEEDLDLEDEDRVRFGRAPVDGDTVLIVGGDLFDPRNPIHGRVKYVNPQLRMACVCVPVSVDDKQCFSKPLLFDEVRVDTNTVVKCACKDCRKEVPRPGR